MKKIVAILMVAIFLTGCSKSVPSSKFNSLQSEYATLQSNYDNLQAEHNTTQSNCDELEKKFTTLDTDYQAMVSDSLKNIMADTKDDLFADLIMEGIKLDYEYDGTMLYDGVAQINVVSEQSSAEDFDYISGLLKDNSITLASLLETYGLNILYFKVVDNDGFQIFEYSYIFGETNEVKMSVGLDFINELN